MKYLLRSKRFPGNSVLLDYTPEGWLGSVTFQGGWQGGQKSYFLQVVPTVESDMEAVIGNSFHIAQEIDSLEFSDFWNAYAYKVGNKKRAEKLWNQMQDIEKVTCMRSIKSYDAYLINHPKMEKCYPETYLAQRRFESIYK